MNKCIRKENIFLVVDYIFVTRGNKTLLLQPLRYLSTITFPVYE